MQGVGCKGKTGKTFFIFFELKNLINMALLAQTNPTTLSKCVVMVLCYPKV